jgi:hypothetical protein
MTRAQTQRQLFPDSWKPPQQISQTSIMQNVYTRLMTLSETCAFLKNLQSAITVPQSKEGKRMVISSKAASQNAGNLCCHDHVPSVHLHLSTRASASRTERELSLKTVILHRSTMVMMMMMMMDMTTSSAASRSHVYIQRGMHTISGNDHIHIP